jgi:hypothetical protein
LTHGKAEHGFGGGYKVVKDYVRSLLLRPVENFHSALDTPERLASLVRTPQLLTPQVSHKTQQGCNVSGLMCGGLLWTPQNHREGSFGFATEIKLVVLYHRRTIKATCDRRANTGMP